jgi:hypothetical protein
VYAGAIQQANQVRDGFICCNNPILLHSDVGFSSRTEIYADKRRILIIIRNE